MRYCFASHHAEDSALPRIRQRVVSCLMLGKVKRQPLALVVGVLQPDAQGPPHLPESRLWVRAAEDQPLN